MALEFTVYVILHSVFPVEKANSMVFELFNINLFRPSFLAGDTEQLKYSFINVVIIFAVILWIMQFLMTLRIYYFLKMNVNDEFCYQLFYERRLNLLKIYMYQKYISFIIICRKFA